MQIKQNGNNLNDFDIFKLIVSHIDSSFTNKYEKTILETEVQHFLAIAYSHFQLKVDSRRLELWPWGEWLKPIKRYLVGAVSFNYDLVLENTFKIASISYRRIGINAETIGIPILKPHGSIDFEIDGLFAPVGYPLRNAVSRNNYPLRSLGINELLEPRTEVDIVLPNEYSTLLNFQWIAPGYNWFEKIGTSLTHCVFIGLSYWECDRPEIDFLLNCLANETKVIIANPYPPDDFVRAVQNKFETSEIWLDGPESLANFT